jgi:hypothetical protein
MSEIVTLQQLREGQTEREIGRIRELVLSSAEPGFPAEDRDVDCPFSSRSRCQPRAGSARLSLGKTSDVAVLLHLRRSINELGSSKPLLSRHMPAGHASLVARPACEPSIGGKLSCWELPQGRPVCHSSGGCLTIDHGNGSRVMEVGQSWAVCLV